MIFVRLLRVLAITKYSFCIDLLQISVSLIYCILRQSLAIVLSGKESLRVVKIDIIKPTNIDNKATDEKVRRINITTDVIDAPAQ